jgi:uncharacterized membrane protein YphA (DoxX/SURF4 family)
MKHAGLIARILLGLIFFVFGLNGFFNFIPVPPPPEAGMKFLGALGGTGYFFPVLKATETIAGLALLSGFFAPLALVILAPIIVNIFLYHYFLAPEGLALPIVIVVLALYLGHHYRMAYKSLFKVRD